jgi:site-specific recombinase XerD
MNISHATDLWLGELERQGHSDRTVDTYRRLLHKLADDHARHVDVGEITITHLRRFLDSQARRRDGSRKAASTVAQNVSIVTGLFDWLTKEGVIQRNPTRRNGDPVITRPRQIRPEENDNVTTISADGVRRLIEVANRTGWPERIAVNCLAYLGPRRNALSRLRVRDYDPLGRRLSFVEKGGHTIEKPVPHDLARIIEAAIVAGVYSSDDDYLVPSRASQRRVGDRDDRIIWRLVCDVAQTAGVTTHVHALRAAFAVHFLETHGGELLALKDLMGHKRIETTLVYLRRLDRRQAMETVRDLSWNEPVCEESLEAKPVTEKEGFEPSFDANPHPQAPGSQRPKDAPRKQLSDDLIEKVRAILARVEETA